MSKRIAERTVQTPEVQGEGSWIRVRALTVGEIFENEQQLEFRRTIWALLGALLGRIVAFFAPWRSKRSRSQAWLDFAFRVTDKVTGWNWVDGDGDTLPLPSEDRRVVRNLSEKEISAIAQAVYGRAETEEQKN